MNGNINFDESFKQLDNARKNIESIFNELDKLKPPYNCVKLHLKILKSLSTLQEAVTLNYEYLNNKKKGIGDESNLSESVKILEEFRKEFHILSQEVNALLQK